MATSVGEGAKPLSLNIPPDITGHRVPDRLDRRRAAVTLGSSQLPFASTLFQSLVGKSAVNPVHRCLLPDVPGQCVYFLSPLSLPSLGLYPHSSTHKPNCSSRLFEFLLKGHRDAFSVHDETSDRVLCQTLKTETLPSQSCSALILCEHVWWPV